ncbi:MAG: phosphoribosylanthranilate isomerase [bacterium]|nr:phosphoribosylanthranilate isomerase [bacterium]
MKKIPKVKICGITSERDALLACLSGADYLGFVIDRPESPRNISIDATRKIISSISEKFKGQVLFAGVFVNKDLNEVKAIVRDCGLHICQLHGEETVGYVLELKKSCEVWKAVIIKTEADKEKIRIYKNIADKILLDAGRGSGKSINLSLLRNEPIDILAGGLDFQNITTVLDQVLPDIVDASSGLEASPGKKDKKLVEAFIKIAKQPSI